MITSASCDEGGIVTVGAAVFGLTTGLGGAAFGLVMLISACFASSSVAMSLVLVNTLDLLRSWAPPAPAVVVTIGNARGGVGPAGGSEYIGRGEAGVRGDMDGFDRADSALVLNGESPDADNGLSSSAPNGGTRADLLL